MKLKRADLREKKANSDHFYVGNMLVYDFIAANMTKKKDCGTKLKNNGPFAASGHMVHAGGQAAHWDIQNKENSNLS